jgi:hypothetical protein
LGIAAQTQVNYGQSTGFDIICGAKNWIEIENYGHAKKNSG